MTQQKPKYPFEPRLWQEGLTFDGTSVTCIHVDACVVPRICELYKADQESAMRGFKSCMTCRALGNCPIREKVLAPTPVSNEERT